MRLFKTCASASACQGKEQRRPEFLEEDVFSRIFTYPACLCRESSRMLEAVASRGHLSANASCCIARQEQSHSTREREVLPFSKQQATQALSECSVFVGRDSLQEVNHTESVHSAKVWGSKSREVFRAGTCRYRSAHSALSSCYSVTWAVQLSDRLLLAYTGAASAAHVRCFCCS